jgi:hypothetical protein
MPTTNTPIFAQSIVNPVVQILPADNTGYKTLRIGSTNGDRIDNIIVTSTDTSARTLQFAINDGTTDYPIGEVVVPATAGTDGAATVKGINVLSIGNFPGLNVNGSFYLQATFSLKVRSETVVTSGKQISVVGFGGAY